MERLIFKVTIKFAPVLQRKDCMEESIALIKAKPHLAEYVKDVYFSSLTANRSVSSVLTLCANLRHVACHVNLVGNPSPCVEKTPIVMGLLRLHALRSLCVPLKTFSALVQVSDAASPWLQNLTHVQILVDFAGYSLSDPGPESLPPVHLLLSLTHFAVLHTAFVTPRQFQNTRESVPMILGSAPALVLLVVCCSEEHVWYEEDPRVVMRMELYVKSSQGVKGWEMDVDNLQGSLWADAEIIREGRSSRFADARGE